MISIDPMRKLEESVSRHDVVELLAVDPKFDWAKDCRSATTFGCWTSSSSRCA